jgi:hypothetical protein
MPLLHGYCQKLHTYWPNRRTYQLDQHIFLGLLSLSGRVNELKSLHALIISNPKSAT